MRCPIVLRGQQSRPRLYVSHRGQIKDRAVNGDAEVHTVVELLALTEEDSLENYQFTTAVHASPVDFNILRLQYPKAVDFIEGTNNSHASPLVFIPKSGIQAEVVALRNFRGAIASLVRSRAVAIRNSPAYESFSAQKKRCLRRGIALSAFGILSIELFDEFVQEFADLKRKINLYQLPCIVNDDSEHLTTLSVTGSCIFR